MKIFGQKKEDGRVYYYTNIKTNEIRGEEKKETWSKMIVGFPKDKEPMLGSVTIDDFNIFADKIINQEKEEKEYKTYYKLFLKEYHKTEEDLEYDSNYIQEGKSFIREYKEYEPKESATKKEEVSPLVDTIQEDDLPF